MLKGSGKKLSQLDALDYCYCSHEAHVDVRNIWHWKFNFFKVSEGVLNVMEMILGQYFTSVILEIQKRDIQLFFFTESVSRSFFASEMRLKIVRHKKCVQKLYYISKVFRNYLESLMNSEKFCIKGVFRNCFAS